MPLRTIGNTYVRRFACNDYCFYTYWQHFLQSLPLQARAIGIKFCIYKLYVIPLLDIYLQMTIKINSVLTYCTLSLSAGFALVKKFCPYPCTRRVLMTFVKSLSCTCRVLMTFVLKSHSLLRTQERQERRTVTGNGSFLNGK